jgi:N6-adenosine-specific RNA methylase IME4
MNGRLAKKVRKLSRRQFFEYVEMVKEWPLRDRLWFAWHRALAVGKGVRVGACHRPRHAGDSGDTRLHPARVPGVVLG